MTNLRARVCATKPIYKSQFGWWLRHSPLVLEYTPSQLNRKTNRYKQRKKDVTESISITQNHAGEHSTSKEIKTRARALIFQLGKYRLSDVSPSASNASTDADGTSGSETQGEFSSETSGRSLIGKQLPGTFITQAHGVGLKSLSMRPTTQSLDAERTREPERRLFER